MITKDRLLSDLFRPYNTQIKNNPNAKFKIPQEANHWLDFRWMESEIDILHYHAAIWC